MSNFQLQLEKELHELCGFWNLPVPAMRALPRKTLLPGESIESEENVVCLGEMKTFFGPMTVFHSVDARDILGSANWARGWSSCLTHRERGKKEKFKPADETREQEMARFDDARDVALWAAECVGVSLLFVCDGKTKTQSGITRRAFRARSWLFELECGAFVTHTIHGGHFEFGDWHDWVEEEGGARFGLLSAGQGHQNLIHASTQERMVKGSGPLCPALNRKRERVVWRGFDAHQTGAPLKGPRFWKSTHTRLCLQAGCKE